MAQLEYASLTDLTDIDAGDEHGYRFRAGAWRFAWLWWNLALLTILAMVVALASADEGTAMELFEQCQTDFLLYAPLAIALSVLVAHGKFDLSFPFQQILALMIFGTLTADQTNVGLLVSTPASNATMIQSAGIAVGAAAAVGFFNWWMCSVLRAPSAVATLLLSAVLLCAALAVVPDIERIGRMGNLRIDPDLVTKGLWIVLVLVLAPIVVATLWLLGGRRRTPREQERRQLGTELLAFLLVSVASGLMGVLVIAMPSAQGYGIQLGTQVLGMPQVAIVGFVGVLVGGTIVDGRLPNPLGAMLGVALTIATAQLALEWRASSLDMYSHILVRSLIGHVPLAASSLVILLYGRRLVTILRATQNPRLELEPPSRGAWALACLALTPSVASPLHWVFPHLLGDGRDGPEYASRAIFGMALLAASLTYLPLVLADALLCKQHRRRAAVAHLSVEPASSTLA